MLYQQNFRKVKKCYVLTIPHLYAHPRYTHPPHEHTHQQGGLPLILWAVVKVAEIGFKRIIWAALCRGLRRQSGDKGFSKEAIPVHLSFSDPLPPETEDAVRSSHRMLISIPWLSRACLHPHLDSHRPSSPALLQASLHPG